MTDSTSRFDVDCYVRPPVEGATRQVVETLETHDRAGRLNSLTVETWPAAVSRDSTVTTDVLETVEGFREWASERGARLEPAFSFDEPTHDLTGERRSLVRLPVVCLAVYEDDDLYCVIPNRTEERTCTVWKALETLEPDDPAHRTAFADAVHPESQALP